MRHQEARDGKFGGHRRTGDHIPQAPVAFLCRPRIDPGRSQRLEIDPAHGHPFTEPSLDRLARDRERLSLARSWVEADPDRVHPGSTLSRSRDTPSCNITFGKHRIAEPGQALMTTMPRCL